jgi:hypothetical protein
MKVKIVTKKEKLRGLYVDKYAETILTTILINLSTNQLLTYSSSSS